MEKRKYSRVRIKNIRVLYKKKHKFSEFFPYSAPLPVKNISRWGICLQFSDDIASVGEIIEIKILMPHLKTFKLIGKIIWSKKDSKDRHYDVGVQFLPVSTLNGLNSPSAWKSWQSISQI